MEVLFEQVGSQLNAQITLDGTIEVSCDRCLGLFDLPVHFEDRVIAKLGEETDLDGDVWILGSEVHELDLSQPIFEFAHLALPTRRIHSDEADCDPDMLDLLDGPEGGSDDEEPMDPRWNALKELK